MELLVVIGIITTFVGVIGYGFLRGSASSTVGLQAAQSMIVALLTQARSQAAISGESAALLVLADPTDPSRYLRSVVVAVSDGSTPAKWSAADDPILLPSDVYVIPPSGPYLGSVNLKESPAESWKRGSDSEELASTALVNSTLATAAVVPFRETLWHAIAFSPRGTTFDSGDIVLVRGRSAPPGDERPVILTNPDNVRGVSVSIYGHVRLINTRADF